MLDHFNNTSKTNYILTISQDYKFRQPNGKAMQYKEFHENVTWSVIIMMVKHVNLKFDQIWTQNIIKV